MDKKKLKKQFEADFLDWEKLVNWRTHLGAEYVWEWIVEHLTKEDPVCKCLYFKPCWECVDCGKTTEDVTGKIKRPEEPVPQPKIEKLKAHHTTTYEEIIETINKLIDLNSK